MVPRVVAALLLLQSGPAGAGASAAAGLVVEEVGRASAAELAGLRPGDRLTAWSRAGSGVAPAASGRLVSPLDLVDLEVSHAPRGVVTLTGIRGSGALLVVVPPGEWKLRARPAMPQGVEETYERGRTLVVGGHVGEGVAVWREAAILAASERPELGVWLQVRIAEAWLDARRWDEGIAAGEEGCERTRATGDTIRRAAFLDLVARGHEGRPDLAAAEKALTEALALREALPDGGLTATETLYRLGRVAFAGGDLQAAEDRLRRVLSLQESLAPDSFPMGATLTSLGFVLAWRSRLEEAESLFRGALALYERIAPGSPRIGVAWAGLGGVAYQRGEWDVTETFWRRCLALSERLDPDGLHVASDLGNLGALATERGDLAGAVVLFRRALVIRERLTPGDAVVALAHVNLGLIARRQGDFDEADGRLRKGLALLEAFGPERYGVASALTGLGDVALDRGRLDDAALFYRRALAMQERLTPGSSAVASTLARLGALALRTGDLAAAEESLRRALAIHERVSPEGYAVAESLRWLGDVAGARQDAPAAEALYRRALLILERVAPAHAFRAETFHALAGLLRGEGRAEEAADAYGRAVEVLESQTERLGGATEVRAGFASRHADLYSEQVDVLASLGRHDAAFGALERSRARMLLDLLAERDLVFSADVPADLERERKRLDFEYEGTQKELGTLSPVADTARVEALLTRFRELRDLKAAAAEKVRKASPRYASLRRPEPLDVGGVRTALDPGTLLLSYSVGRDRSLLFAVRAASDGAPGLAVFLLSVGTSALRERVTAFRTLVGRAAAGDASFEAAARSLYDLLVRPAQDLVARADRVLLVPDGPLHTLPFAALRDREAYFVERRPLHVAFSATVYGALRQWRPSGPRPRRFVAFGDPRPPARPDLAPLPAARREVEHLAAVLRDRSGTHMGDDATEERAKAVGRDAGYVHFACHALLNERFPLSSALVLAAPPAAAEGRDNGLLQAWEVLERVRLDADLVTLSSCETALATEEGGQGLLGLTQAFHAAGARSVLSSLWSVADESTATLMVRFYTAVASGRPKDEALREAQVAFIRGGGTTSRPFHWAAFPLAGDWK